MKLSKKALIVLLVISIAFFIVIMAIQVVPKFLNTTDEIIAITRNQTISILSSVSLIIISLLTITLYRKKQEK